GGVASATLTIGVADALTAFAGDANRMVGVQTIARRHALDALTRETYPAERGAVFVRRAVDTSIGCWVAVLARHASSTARTGGAALEALETSVATRALRSARAALLQPLLRFGAVGCGHSADRRSVRADQTLIVFTVGSLPAFVPTTGDDASDGLD